MKRRLFIAGSTGAVGRTLVDLCRAHATPYVAHQRRKPGRVSNVSTLVCDLSERSLVSVALQECTTVVQLIGTMRQRFKDGDTYESSDIGTTQTLVDLSRGTPVDHFIFLSSLGTGVPIGPYLRAKAQAERIVRESGIPFTILRPSMFEGEGHHVPRGAHLLANLPILRQFAPISVREVAEAIHRVAADHAPINSVIEGHSLFHLITAP